MKKLSLFPWNADTKTVLEYRDLLTEYELVSIISFQEDEVNLSRRAQLYDIRITSDPTEGLQGVDVLVLADNPGGYRIDKYKNCIHTAKEMGIEILCSRKLQEELDTTDVRLLEYVYPAEKLEEAFRLKELTAPVIPVMGLGQNCSKFEAQLLLIQALRGQGYTPAVYCSNCLGMLYGAYTYPDYLFSKEYTYEEKILMFNRELYQLCKKEEPDVIVLGFPGGIMPLGEQENNHFSELPLILSSAVVADAGVLCSYAPQFREEGYLEGMQNYCLQKYNVPVEVFLTARQRLEFDPEKQIFLFYNLDEKTLQKVFEKCNSAGATNMADRDSAIRAMERMIRLLEENVATV